MLDQSIPMPVTVTVYTDPLCVWSWAAEGPWRRLQYEFGAQLAWHTRLAGMVVSWDQFEDPLHAVARPAQMGPLWMQARYMTGAAINEVIWVADPPGSSYPACIAVKAAECQGAAAGAAYLRRVREAVMLEQRNIARRDVLVALADELAERELLDATRFRHDLESPAALESFRADLHDLRYRDLARLPALIMRRADGAALLMVGYRPYADMRAALAHLVPEIQTAHTAADAVDYARYWGSVTPSEVAEALGCQPQEAATHLDMAVAEGHLARSGMLYRSLLPLSV